MTGLHYLLILPFFCGITKSLAAQTAPPGSWEPPRHQFMAQFGEAFNDDRVREYTRNMPMVGLTYYYNFARHWYVGADAQYMQKGFLLNDLNKIAAPSPENPVTLPLIKLYLDKNRGSLRSDLTNADVVKLTTNQSYHIKRQLNLNFGYTKVSPRNLLRIGLGFTYWNTQYRDLYSYLTDVNSNAGVLYLAQKSISNTYFNGIIAYDFFLNERLTVGLRLMTSQFNFGASELQSGITIGYALPGR